MKLHVTLGLAASIAIAVNLATPVRADPPRAPSPAGNWSFATETMGAGCKLSGEIAITKTADNAFKCSFRATWGCAQRLPRSVETQQSCIATQTGDDIVITSSMQKVAKVDPVVMTEEMKQRYAADHFNVKINKRGDEMNGIFRSYGQAPVKFRKHLDLIG